jgi:hypothetical protein
MKHTLMRFLAATALVCGLAGQAWAQAATAALQAIPDLAPLYNPVPIDSVATHRSWASGRGIYAFFASDTAQALLRRAGLSVGDDGLVYIGQTKNSFRQRLSNHFTGTSNLRSSLRSILSHVGSKAARADVSRFMRSNFRVAMLWIDDATVIDTVEARLIRATSPPLNRAGVSNANTKRLKQLRKVLTTTTPTGTAVSTLAKGTGIGVLVELPVTAAVEYLHVRNGRKTPEEAAIDGARTVGTAAVVGAVAAGAFSAAATAGVTVSAPFVMPLAVVGGGLYVWVSGDRIWNAVHEDTRTTVEARFAAAAAAVGWGDSEAADRP